MRKIVKISGKEYSMQSSAYTQFKYKNDTGRKMLDDLRSIMKLAESTEDEQISASEDLIELLLKMSYIMIEEADKKQVGSYEDFLKSIDGLFDETEWINEVVELATSPISRKLQGTTTSDKH